MIPKQPPIVLSEPSNTVRPPTRRIGLPGIKQSQPPYASGLAKGTRIPAGIPYNVGISPQIATFKIGQAIQPNPILESQESLSRDVVFKAPTFVEKTTHYLGRFILFFAKMFNLSSTASNLQEHLTDLAPMEPLPATVETVGSAVGSIAIAKPSSRQLPSTIARTRPAPAQNLSDGDRSGLLRSMFFSMHDELRENQVSCQIRQSKRAYQPLISRTTNNKIIENWASHIFNPRARFSIVHETLRGNPLAFDIVCHVLQNGDARRALLLFEELAAQYLGVQEEIAISQSQRLIALVQPCSAYYHILLQIIKAQLNKGAVSEESTPPCAVSEKGSAYSSHSRNLPLRELNPGEQKAIRSLIEESQRGENSAIDPWEWGTAAVSINGEVVVVLDPYTSGKATTLFANRFFFTQGLPKIEKILNDMIEKDPMVITRNIVISLPHLHPESIIPSTKGENYCSSDVAQNGYYYTSLSEEDCKSLDLAFNKLVEGLRHTFGWQGKIEVCMQAVPAPLRSPEAVGGNFYVAELRRVSPAVLS